MTRVDDLKTRLREAERAAGTDSDGPQAITLTLHEVGYPNEEGVHSARVATVLRTERKEGDWVSEIEEPDSGFVETVEIDQSADYDTSRADHDAGRSA